MRPAARLDGVIVAVVAAGVGILRTIAFAFATEIGLVLLFEPVQPEAVLSFTHPAPPAARAAGGPR